MKNSRTEVYIPWVDENFKCIKHYFSQLEQRLIFFRGKFSTINQKRHGRSKSGTVNENTHVYLSNVIVVFYVKAVYEIFSSFLRFSKCLR